MRQSGHDFLPVRVVGACLQVPEGAAGRRGRNLRPLAPVGGALLSGEELTLGPPARIIGGNDFRRYQALDLFIPVSRLIGRLSPFRKALVTVSSHSTRMLVS